MWSSPGPRQSEGVVGVGVAGRRAKPWFRDGGDSEGDDEEVGRGRTFSDTEVGMGSRTTSGNNLAGGSGSHGSHQRGEKPAVVFKEVRWRAYVRVYGAAKSETTIRSEEDRSDEQRRRNCREAKRVAEEELLVQQCRFAPRRSSLRRHNIRSALSLRCSRPSSRC